MNYSLYRYVPFSTSALRQLVCALEGVVIVQFWLTSPVVRTLVWRVLVAAWSLLTPVDARLHAVRTVWLLMGLVMVAAFGLLLLLRWLLPVAAVADTTEADVERLLTALIEPTLTTSREP